MRMVELQPRLFLSCSPRAVAAQVAAANALLREALAGADIEAMLVEDPALLFEELQSLETGIRTNLVTSCTCALCWPRSLQAGSTSPCGGYMYSLRAIHAGLAAMHELWDVNEQVLRDCDPVEVALAVRALSCSGPPRVY